ncbi:hypothetical protein FGO68_gene12806 [Halteria grandinella]|uniref:Uncharacterized protein n=1 Tax=Halteria grandinella TaxID=5974 RepID=A0A8J8NDU5_HALGN|nr:hypothetical protein FGO68_gene12806 [Halteria grandinella]
MEAFSNSDIDVPLRGTFSKRSMTQLKKFKISERCFSGFSSRQNILDKNRSSFKNTATKEDAFVDLDKTMNSVNTANIVGSGQKEPLNMRFSQARPSTTCNKCHKDRPMIIRKPNSNMSVGEITQNISVDRRTTQMDTNAIGSGGKAQSALVENASIGQATFDLIRQSVQTNQQESQEQSMLGLKAKIRVQSMLPRTATNYHKFKKGLYLNPLKGNQYDISQDALARSMNLLKARGDALPLKTVTSGNSKPAPTDVASSKEEGDQEQQQMTSTQVSNHDSSLYRNDRNRPPQTYMERYEERSAAVFSIAPIGSYVTVIRESPTARKRRFELREKQRELLNMDFDNKRKSEMMTFINSFMKQKKISQGMLDSSRERRQIERSKIRHIYRQQ